VREAFFAARTFRDLDDLNAQAAAWCEGACADRWCPQDRARTVRTVFAEEAPRLLALPENPFPTEERIEVSVGKSPYARFDLNDYTVPHTHVNRTLSVLATLDTVRILDGSAVLAIHRRTFDRGAQIEIKAHLEALVTHKRAARAHRAQDRLHHAAPGAKPLHLARRRARRTPGCAHPRSAGTARHPRRRRRSPPHWPKTPRTWAPCVTSSTSTPTPAAKPRPSRWSCPKTRACTPSACARRR
jgi:hypothetical protein